MVQLEEARTKADSRVSNHKQATQLLQTELQDSRAHVDEKEKAIQSLKSKLRESEVGLPLPPAATHTHTHTSRPGPASIKIFVIVTEKCLTECCGARRAVVQPL